MASLVQGCKGRTQGTGSPIMVRIQVRTEAFERNFSFFGLATHGKIVILRGPKRDIIHRFFADIRWFRAIVSF
jgi:hypothetical protein